MMIELLNEPWQFLDISRVWQFYHEGIIAVREVLPEMPILLHDSFRPHRWNTLFKNYPFNHTYMDTHAYHSFNAADIAAETEEEDREKIYAHEKIACGYTGSLRYQTCNTVPVLVGEWSLAIDNCMDHLDARFKNYGQCDRIEERLTSDWWKDHIASFAQRQIAMYERELGWSFWTWKVDEVGETKPSAVWWSFRLAVEMGYIDTTYPRSEAHTSELQSLMRISYAVFC